MRRHVVDALTIHVDLATVAEAFEILLAREWPPFFRHGLLAFEPVHEGSSIAFAQSESRSGASSLMRRPCRSCRLVLASFQTGLAASSTSGVAAVCQRG